MITKSLLALSFAAAVGVAIPAAHADYGHGDNRDYRSEHRDDRGHYADRRDFGHDRYARERHDRYDHYARHEYRPYYQEPRGYVMAAPVYAPPPILYSQPSGINLVFPIDLR